MKRVALALLRNRPRHSRQDDAPRDCLLEDQFDVVYDQSILDSAPPSSNVLARRIPFWLRLALELQRRSDEYDAIVTWGERLSLTLMALQHFSGQGKPHIPMMYWFSKPIVEIPMRAFGDSLHALITWSDVQREYAIEHVGLPPERVHLLDYQVDQLFYSPRGSAADMICSAGSEMRDYATLLEALRDTGIRCHIASDHVRVPRRLSLRHHRSTLDGLEETAGQNITIKGLLTEPEIRDLYAKSRFVVVPVFPSETNHGITVILEAMAMGKAVICSRTHGLSGLLVDGVTGIYVPVGEPLALREAILDLWRNPERAQRIGSAARAQVEQQFTLDAFCANVMKAVNSSLVPPAGSPLPIHCN